MSYQTKYETHILNKIVNVKECIKYKVENVLNIKCSHHFSFTQDSLNFICNKNNNLVIKNNNLIYM